MCPGTLSARHEKVSQRILSYRISCVNGKRIVLPISVDYHVVTKLLVAPTGSPLGIPQAHRILGELESKSNSCRNCW